MKIEYLGHACFLIDESLVIDPHKDGLVPGLEPLRVSAVMSQDSNTLCNTDSLACIDQVLFNANDI